MRISDWSSDVCSSDLVHYADLHAQLVDEDHRAARPADRPRQLAQALRHQTRLEPAMAVAHLAFDIGARHQRGDRVDDEHVDRVREIGRHTSELPSPIRSSYDVFCLNKYTSITQHQ